MIINRTWAMPNSKTFSILPIKQLIEKYIDTKKVIVDPFANDSNYGTITNDLNPKFNTNYHLDALTFLRQIDGGSADYVLYDPPYSLTQAAQCYNSFGKEKLKASVANMKYWKEIKDEISRIVKVGGIVLSFGWNTNGCGKGRGFECLEVLIVCHGGSKNDTLCMVEQKIFQQEKIESF